LRSLFLFLLVLSGCATVVPAQPASTVPAGTYRVSGAMSQGVWCGVRGHRCTLFPDGAVLPELRANLRRGIVEGVDVGASAYTLLPLGDSGVRLGGFLDGKVEVWDRELEPGRRQIVSVGLGGGGAFNRSFTGRNYWEADLALPVFFGHQTERVELVAGARFAEKLSFLPMEGARFHHYSSAGLLVGAFSRGKARVGGQLSYDAPLEIHAQGVWNLSFSVHHEFGG